MNEETESKLRQLLHTSETPVEIMFLKKDGSERRMKATTNISLIPEEFQVKTVNEDGSEVKKRKQNDDVMPVFDVEKKGWRSFRKENLKEINNETIKKFLKNK